MALARFRVTGFGPNVSASELQAALSTQLALDDVVLDVRSLKKRSDGICEAVFELPNVEADMVRGPMKQAKVFIGATMVLNFKEVTGQTEPLSPRTEPGTQTDLDRTRVVRQGPDAVEQSAPSTSLNDITQVVPRQGLGNSEDPGSPNTIKNLSLRQEKPEPPDRGRPSHTSSFSIEERLHALRQELGAPEFDSKDVVSKDHAIERQSMGPDMAHCSNVLPLIYDMFAGGPTDGEPKSTRACQAPCAIQ